MQKTSNYALNKPEQTDVVNIEDLNANFDTLDTEIKKVSDKANLIQTAGGTGTAITLNNISLVNGFTVTFVVAANNSGAATTINGKALYKPGGTSAPTLTAGKAVTVWYNGTSFFIKASAEGNSVAADVLASKTFSNDSDTGLTGTMPNNGAVSQSLGINGTYNIPAGYHNGSGKVTQSITMKAAATYNPSTSAQTIAAGQYLSGAQTVAATTGTSVVGDVLSGKTFNSANGIGLTGTMHNNGSVGTQSLTTEGAEYTIPAGYHNGLGKVKAAITGLIASVIKAGTAVGGILGTFTADATATSGHILSGATAYVNGNKVTGNIPIGGNDEYAGWVRGNVSQAPQVGRAHFYIPTNKYYNGDGNNGQQGVFVDNADFISANILSGKNIFGMVGTAVQGKRFASGRITGTTFNIPFEFMNTYVANLPYIEISGLTFLPSKIMAYGYDNNNALRFMNYIDNGSYYPKVVWGGYADLMISSGHSSGQIKADTQSAYVNASGFRLPADAQGVTYTWMAIE